MTKEVLVRVVPAVEHRYRRLLRIRLLKQKLEKLEREELGRVKSLGLPVGSKVVIEEGPIQGEVKHYTQIEISKAAGSLLLDHLVDAGFTDCLKLVLDKDAIKRKRPDDVRLDRIVSGYEEPREYWKVEPKAST